MQKPNPDKVNMSSAGVGSIGHLAGELFKMMSGVNMVHVPFGGNSPALTALLGGQVEVSFASMPSSIEFMRTGNALSPAGFGQFIADETGKWAKVIRAANIRPQ
jgi:tripartite-type tricarboxylate transporter receptor subunit TctC